MWPPVTSMMRAGWVCVFLAAVSVDSEIIVYGEVGGKVVLRPDTAFATGSVTSIVWKDGANIAMDWDGAEIDRKRHFAERGNLSTATGEMTLTGLIRSDSGLYTPIINEKAASSIRLVVISPVPEPTVLPSCHNEKTLCTLTCDGNTTEAGPITYIWKSGDTVLNHPYKELHIKKEDNLNMTEFSCELKNPVSQQSSSTLTNPLITTAPERIQRISTGLTVFISLLAAVLFGAIFHRWKAGMWFFQKESMPWERDFWRKNERPPKDAVGSNGATTPQKKEQTDEETPMT